MEKEYERQKLALQMDFASMEAQLQLLRMSADVDAHVRMTQAFADKTVAVLQQEAKSRVGEMAARTCVELAKAKVEAAALALREATLRAACETLSQDEDSSESPS